MPDLTQPSIHSARRERARTRRVSTSSHTFADTRTHPSRAPFARLHPRVASRRLHHRPPASPPPSASSARRPPPTPTPTPTFGDARTRDANARVKIHRAHIRAHTTHRSSRANVRGRRHRRLHHRPHHRPRGIESAASDVTAGRRWMWTPRRVCGFFLLMGFDVCPLRMYVVSCRVVSCVHDES